jgi:hypothetical protein
VNFRLAPPLYFHRQFNCSNRSRSTAFTAPQRRKKVAPEEAAGLPTASPHDLDNAQAAQQ